MNNKGVILFDLSIALFNFSVAILNFLVENYIVGTFCLLFGILMLVCALMVFMTSRR